MSKSVRLPDYLHAEIERLAAEEKRSLANMVKVLLEQALAMDNETVVPIAISGEGMERVEGHTSPAAVRKLSDPHFKPDFK